MSTFNRRMSLGGGALRPVSSHNRRMSISGGPLRSETPKKDRRAMLEEYRQKRARESSLEDSFDHSMTKSRPPMGPPVPRRHNAVFSEATGESALDRIRRMQEKRQRNTLYGNDENMVNGPYYEEGDTLDYSKLGATTPGRPSSILALPRPPVPTSRKPTTLSSQESMLSQESDGAQLSQESISGSVESEARYQVMQQRLRELEEEKMGITIAIAPMEARHRQKEDAWLKEQNRLLQEIDSLKSAGRAADERFRDLLAQFEAKEEENRQLRLQVRKESTSVYSNNGQAGSSWSRHLQADRDVQELREKLQNAEEEIRAVRLDRVSVEKELHATKIERDSIVRAYEELQEEYNEISDSQTNDQDAQIQLEVLTNEHIATSAQLNAVCSDLAATKAAFEEEIKLKDEAYKKEVERYEFEMSVLKTRAANGLDENGLSTSMTDSDIEDYAVLKARIEERDRKIAEFEKERLAWEAQRRQMHNRIQELRGNIRVFVRTRPFLPNDGNEVVSAIDVSPDGESLSILDARTSSPYDFKFDKVFAPSSGQDHVFEEVSDFVQSAIDGYHVCLFSYGQTGSGKTHTMQGSGNGAMRGIIPRAVEQILTRAKELQGQKWVFNLSASFLEIYNENLKDLLVDMSGKSCKNPPKLSIKRSREGKSYVENLTEVPIETMNSVEGLQQLEALMKVAARSRSVASTKMNAQSSRSHSVFMLHLRGYNDESGAEVQGALNLCDLAGSERLDRSGASSDAKRLRETQAINKSLSCLGDVFNALAQKASHVPYRNSKLTYLLQDCLSGDGKALMFVNLSPTNASSNESLCSLRFAQRVNQVELGKATKHINYKR